MAGRRYRLVLFFAVLLPILVSTILAPKTARGFGNDDAFNPRMLLVGDAKVDNQRSTAPSRLSWELIQRTNAPARLVPTTVRADSTAIANEPFAWWLGRADAGALTNREIEGLRVFFALGGVLLVDDSDPQSGAFGRGARRELARVLPDSAPVPIGPEHVVFRSYYLLSRPAGRVDGPDVFDAIIRNGHAQVLFSSHDIAGALSRDRSGVSLFEMATDNPFGGERHREMAVRTAVNVAMFVLCSNYKDDQVHGPVLMRRRARNR